MGEAIFNVKFTPKSSILVDGYTDRFAVVADVVDPNGVYTSLDVQSNDVVFLDTYNSITSPYTVSKYVVLSIMTIISYESIELVLKYDDTGPPVDPGEVIEISGFMCRRSPGHGLSWITTSQTLGISNYVLEYARSCDMWTIVDKLGRVYWNSYTASTSWLVNHNLNTLNILVQCWDDLSPPSKIAPAKIEIVNSNQLIIDWGGTENVSGNVCVIKSDLI